MYRSIINPIFHKRLLLFVSILHMLLLFQEPVRGQAAHFVDPHPLRPPDTSSPRETLRSFISSLEEAYQAAKIRDAPPEAVLVPMRRARRCLDRSDVAPELFRDVGTETSLLLKEVLDRVGLPPYDKIPDARQVERSELTQWVIPNTEITLIKMAEGPRQGEFLFDAETVAHAREFYDRARHLPYKAGATKGIYAAYILTPGRRIKIWWRDFFPEWANVVFLEQAVWQWISMFVVLLISTGLIVSVYKLGRKWDRRRGAFGKLLRIGKIVSVSFAMVVVLLSEYVLDQRINLTGDVLAFTKVALTLTIYGFIGWLAILILNRIPEAVISSRRLLPRGIDSQLLRLGFRLLSFVVIATLFVEVATRIGLPAYSVVTGLGVGGLAVALAGRETLANLLGSITILFDRPFRVGDWIVVGDKEGTVEDIGFRSTRIRTFYDSILSITNAETASVAIDNMGRRTYRRVKTFIPLTYDTPAEKIEEFVEGIKKIIQAHPMTRKDANHIVLNDFGNHSLDILLYFFLEVPDWTSELVERQRVFLEIIRLAETIEVRFALPTQIQVESFPGQEPLVRSPQIPDEQQS